MKHIVKARKALALLSKKAKGGVNNFALVYSKSDTIYHYGRVCYQVLNYDSYQYHHDRGPIAFLSTIRPLQASLTKDDRVAAIAFLKWTFNSSPFASVFYSKHGMAALRNGIICHTDVDASLLFGGLSLIRELNEEPMKVVIWYELVRLGMDPSYAYIATYFLSSTGDKGFKWKKPLYNYNHLALLATLSAKYIKAFCAGKVINKSHIFRNNTNFMGIFRLWGTAKAGQEHPFKFSKKATKVEHNGWGGYQADAAPLIAFPNEADRITFVREFSHQMKEICDA